ncbi:hypothetical protein [Leptospira harrisiae]|uniref:hypothetical protein n=1 Tax=Leptospira harrisiae TaxID=2023189 RepID=UPI000C2A8B17|nr:hypothetical protein [Leptospira harrisiae]PKA09299.1 hypothetical protein CH366_06215 [Leptospira harrisiae]
MAITKDTYVTVKFEKEIADAINKYAKVNEMDRSKVVRLAVKRFLGVLPMAKSVSTKTKA